MSGRFFITDGAVDGWLNAQGVFAPRGSEQWRRGERELTDLVNLAAERKQPKPDGAQLVYKVGRDLVREVTGLDHPFASQQQGAVTGRLEIYLHVTRDAQLVAVRMRSRAGRPQGSR